MPIQKLTPEIIVAAIEGFEAQKVRLDTQIAELRQLLDGGPTETTIAPETAPRKRKISAAARRRMAAGQKKRWAAIKGESEASAPAPVEAPKPKRHISEEGMKRIIAATKKRWRLVKAAKAQPATAKKKGGGKKAAAAKAAKKTAAKKSRAAGASQTAGTAQ